VLVRSVVANNLTGLFAAGGPAAVLRVGASTITGNDKGLTATDGAILRSFGNNCIAGNRDGDRRRRPRPGSSLRWWNNRDDRMFP
jgi:hypothetical protein